MWTALAPKLGSQPEWREKGSWMQALSLSAMWPEASWCQDHSYRQPLSLWWLPCHGGLYLKTWNKMDSSSLKLPVTAVRKLFPPFPQSYILGFEYNFAFHFNEEDRANLHGICLVPIDYQTLHSLFCAQIESQLCPALHKFHLLFHGILGDQCQCFNFRLEASFSHIIGNNWFSSAHCPIPAQTVAPHPTASPTPVML